MQDDITKNNIDTEIDEVFEGVPEEVENFMISPLYNTIISVIATELKLNNQQTGWVRHVSYELLLKTITPEDAYTYLMSKDLPQETVVKILFAIDTEIVTRATNITEFYTDNIPFEPNDTETLEATESTAPKVTPLSSLSDRLKQASIATPIKRTDNATSLLAEISTPRAIDPYHESIDNE